MRAQIIPISTNADLPSKLYIYVIMVCVIETNSKGVTGPFLARKLLACSD